MAPQVPVPNTVKAEVGGTAGPYNWAGVLHFQYSGGAPTEAQLLSGSTTLLNQYHTHVHALASAGFLLTYSRLTDLASPTGAQAEATGSFPGGDGGVAVGTNVAFLITKNINRRYRGGHPRSYLPPGGSDVVATAGQTWTTAYVTSVTNAYAAFITAVANGGMWSGVGSEVCVHYKLNHIALQVPLIDQVQSYSGQAKFASQRRRVGRK